MTTTTPTPSRERGSVRVRLYAPADQPFILSLAPRLVSGIPPWRDPQKMLATVERWLTNSIAQHGAETMVFVAEDEQQECLGFATVSRSTHFTGVAQAEIGELAVSEAAEGQGVGQALLGACEQWAREQGYRFLALGTGAANQRARGFYQHHGFLDEDVRLVKLLG